MWGKKERRKEKRTKVWAVSKLMKNEYEMSLSLYWWRCRFTLRSFLSGEKRQGEFYFLIESDRFIGVKRMEKVSSGWNGWERRRKSVYLALGIFINFTTGHNLVCSHLPLAEAEKDGEAEEWKIGMSKECKYVPQSIIFTSDFTRNRLEGRSRGPFSGSLSFFLFIPRSLSLSVCSERGHQWAAETTGKRARAKGMI